jgi:hypothetical protein
MHGLACGLIVVAAGLAVAVPVPRPREKEQDSDFALATAGLKPYSRETQNLPLYDFWLRVHPLKADLVVTRVVFSPAQPQVGDLIGATIYYKNIGGQPATNFYLRLEPSTLGEGGVGLGGDHARLAPGEEKPYEWGAIRATKAGVHTLTFTIDPEGSVDESNSRNNRHTVKIRVGAPGE